MLKMYRYVKGNVPEVGSNVITNNPGMVLAHWGFFLKVLSSVYHYLHSV